MTYDVGHLLYIYSSSVYFLRYTAFSLKNFDSNSPWKESKVINIFKYVCNRFPDTTFYNGSLSVHKEKLDSK